MKTTRMMFPLMLALTSGCATTLDQAGVLRQTPDVGGDATTVSNGSACVVAGEVRTIAPKALARSGIELVEAYGGLAVGFNKTPYDAVAMTIDPSSAMTTGSYSRHSA